jgi:hypothetical protein
MLKPPLNAKDEGIIGAVQRGEKGKSNANKVKVDGLDRCNADTGMAAGRLQQ